MDIKLTFKIFIILSVFFVHVDSFSGNEIYNLINFWMAQINLIFCLFSSPISMVYIIKNKDIYEESKGILYLKLNSLVFKHFSQACEQHFELILI